MKNRIYIAIDLKSFYASVECVDRKLDPLTTNLVVADASPLDNNKYMVQIAKTLAKRAIQTCREAAVE